MKIAKRGESLGVGDADFLDGDGKLIARMEGFEATIAPSLAAAFKKNGLAAVEA